MFSPDSTMNTEFLPGISFKYLWSCDITQNTRDTIWKYLQLIIVTIVGSVNKKEAFGETSKIFDSINEEEFKNKLQETMEDMQKMFDKMEEITKTNEVMNQKLDLMEKKLKKCMMENNIKDEY